MRATKENMNRVDREGKWTNVIAYSYDTMEKFSADPSDYFWMEIWDCLIDEQGNEMVLVREVKTVAMVEIDEE